MFPFRAIIKRKSIFPLHPTGESLPKSGISPKSPTGPDVEPALPLAEPLSSPVLVPELPELPEPEEPLPVDTAGAVVTSGIEPNPVWPTGGAWQAPTSKSARMKRVPTSAP